MNGSLPMTRARWAILAAGIPVALIVIAVCTQGWVYGAINALADLNQVGYAVALTVPVGPDGVNVTVGNGDLDFRTGAVSQIRVHGNLSASMARPTFSHRLTPAGLVLDPTCRAPIGTCSASFTITAPAGPPVDLDDSFGQLDTSGLRGDITLTSNSGDISASRLAGTIRLNDSFGDIDATALSGSIRMTSSSGDITAFRVTGDTQISDSYGDVTVDGIAAADVKCTSVSGNVTIEFATVPKNVQVSDSYGDVTLVLPRGGTRYRVSTRNPFGGTSIQVPRSSAAADTITVTDNSGTIRVVNQGGGPPVPNPVQVHPTPTAS